MDSPDQTSPLASFFSGEYLMGADQYDVGELGSVRTPGSTMPNSALGVSPEAPNPATQPPSQETSPQAQSDVQASPQVQQQSQAPVEIQRWTDVKQRACNECRQRKTACYYLKGNDAKCFRCQMDSHECTFTDSPKTAKPTHARPLPTNARSSSTTAVGSGPVEDYSILPGRSLLKKTLSLQHPRSSFAVNQYGLWDKCVLQSVQLDKSNQARVSANLSLRKIADDCLFMVRNDGGQAEWIHDCDEIERAVAPYGRLLVNCYFLWCHQDYPVLHEKIFIEKYTRTYRELTPALLGAVYLLALKHWYRNPELSTVARPAHLGPLLHDLSTAAFFKMSGGASLSLVQAGLLLLQSSYADGRHLSISSVINTTAYRLALHRSCEQWKLPRWEINLRIRISWAVFSQSAWISLIESIPTMVPWDTQWHLSTISLSSFETGGMATPYSAPFTQLMKLSLVVRDIHHLLYRVEPSPDSGISMEEVLKDVKPVQLALTRWFHELPENLSNISSPTSSFSLQFAYIAAEVSLHRYIIRNLARLQQAHRPIDSAIVDVCRSSARDRLDAAVTLIQALRPQHLQGFWYFVSSYHLAIVGLFAALMYTTSDAREESDYYKERLKNYVASLEAYAEVENMAAGVRVLRSSIAGIPGLEIYSIS